MRSSVRDVRDQPLLGVHHAFQRADHLVEAGAGGQELLRTGLQLRMLLQVAARHVIGGVLQLACWFRQAPGQPQQQRGADQHGDDQQQQRPVEHQVDEIGLRAVGGTDQVQLVVVFAVAHRERPDQLDAAVLFLLGMIRIIGLADEVADDLHFVALRADHPAFAGDQQQALARRRPFVDGAEQAAPPHQIVGRIVLQLGLDVLFQHQPLPLLAVEQRGHLAGVELGHHQHQH